MGRRHVPLCRWHRLLLVKTLGSGSLSRGPMMLNSTSPRPNLTEPSSPNSWFQGTPCHGQQVVGPGQGLLSRGCCKGSWVGSHHLLTMEPRDPLSTEADFPALVEETTAEYPGLHNQKASLMLKAKPRMEVGGTELSFKSLCLEGEEELLQTSNRESYTISFQPNPASLLASLKPPGLTQIKR